MNYFEEENLNAKVIDAQTLEIDTVSGATYSSIIIFKAIENALIQVSGS